MASIDNPAWVYEKNQVKAIFEPWARVLIDLAQPQSGEHVLDAACGTGVIARLVAPVVGPTGRTVGLDFDPQMLEVAEAVGPQTEWHQGDLQSLTFADEAFNLVICQQGLQFLPDRAAGLREMHRVLRPGGRLVLALWTELANSPGHAILFQALGAAIAKDMSRPPPWSLAGESQVLQLIEAAGFPTDVETRVTSLQATYASAREFVEIYLAGTSKLTRQALEQIPADRKAAFVDEVVTQLCDYETNVGLQVPIESRLIVARKPNA